MLNAIEIAPNGDERMPSTLENVSAICRINAFLLICIVVVLVIKPYWQITSQFYSTSPIPTFPCVGE